MAMADVYSVILVYAPPVFPTDLTLILLTPTSVVIVMETAVMIVL